MSRVITIANQKGGVGKTTTAINLGAALAVAEQRTLVIDMDPQANASSGLGLWSHDQVAGMYDVMIGGRSIEESRVRQLHFPYLDMVGTTRDLAGAEIELVGVEARESVLRTALEPIRDDYDYILVDCPPSLGLLTLNTLTAADSVLIPIQCEFYALEGLSQLLNTVRIVQRGLNTGLEIEGVLLTMFDKRLNLSKQVAREAREYFGDKVFTNAIPRNVPACRGAELRQAHHRIRCSLNWSPLLPPSGEGSHSANATRDYRDGGPRSFMSVAPNTRLGRGLSALLGDHLDRPVEGEVARLSLDSVGPNPFQPRREFKEKEIRELAASISANGLLQPVLVRSTPAPEHWELVAGERRLRAVTRLGWSEVPAIVREVDDETMLVLALVENLQRRNLGALEEAEGYKVLVEKFQRTQEDIALAVGKSRATVTNILRLLKLPVEVRQLLGRKSSRRDTGGRCSPSTTRNGPSSWLEWWSKAVGPSAGWRRPCA